MDNTYVQPTRTTHNSIHYTNMADADRSFGFVNTVGRYAKRREWPCVAGKATSGRPARVLRKANLLLVDLFGEFYNVGRLFTAF